MNFNEASQKLTTLIERLKAANNLQEVLDAKVVLSDFRAEQLPLVNKELRSLRKIARVTLEEYEDIVTDAELNAIRMRTHNYSVLVKKLNQINKAGTSQEFAPKLDAVLSLITITQKAVQTVKDVKEVGLDQLNENDLLKIDEVLELITSIPNRIV